MAAASSGAISSGGSVKDISRRCTPSRHAVVFPETENVPGALHASCRPLPQCRATRPPRLRRALPVAKNPVVYLLSFVTADFF
ncbi:MAG: hypothetical protein ACTHKB_00020 [Burkholderiaceae bacterium]